MKANRNVTTFFGALFCIAGLVWLASGRQNNLRPYTYSQFVDEVQHDQVASVVVTGSNSGAAHAIFRTKDGRSAQTILPPDFSKLLEDMHEKLINIEVRDPAANPGWWLVRGAPFLLLLGVWIMLMIGGLPKGPGTILTNRLRGLQE